MLLLWLLLPRWLLLLILLRLSPAFAPALALAPALAFALLLLLLLLMTPNSDYVLKGRDDLGGFAPMCCYP